MCKKVIFSVSTLLLGVLIYFLGHKNLLQNLSLIRNFVPDFLWAISFYTFSTIFSKNITKHYIWLTAIYVIILGIIFELLQYTGKVRGTFDIWDIIIYIISVGVACLIEKYYWGDKNEKKNN